MGVETRHAGSEKGAKSDGQWATIWRGRVMVLRLILGFVLFLGRGCPIRIKPTSAGLARFLPERSATALVSQGSHRVPLSLMARLVELLTRPRCAFSLIHPAETSTPVHELVFSLAGLKLVMCC